MGERKVITTESMPQYITLVLRLAAVILAGLAATWFYLYLFTDYMPYRRVYYIPAAVVFLVIALGLWFQLLWIVAFSMCAAMAIASFIIWMLFNGAGSNPSLWVPAVLFGAYALIVGRYLLNISRVRQRS